MSRVPIWVWLLAGGAVLYFVLTRAKAAADAARIAQAATPQALTPGQLPGIAIPSLAMPGPATTAPLASQNVDPDPLMNFNLMGGA